MQKDVPIIKSEKILEILLGALDEYLAVDRRQPRQTSRKDDGSYLTNIDLAIDRYLNNHLNQLLPGIAWFSEESRSQHMEENINLTWVVDPIDGTKELVRDIPEFAISIALLMEGEVIAGGVINPASGVGAAVGTIDAELVCTVDTVIARKKNSQLRECTVSVSRSETEDGLISDALKQNFKEVVPIGSVANKLMRVACGYEDATFSLCPKSSWDICGGIALLKSRDMIFLDLNGEDYVFKKNDQRLKRGFVAGIGPNVKNILNILNA